MCKGVLKAKCAISHYKIISNSHSLTFTFSSYIKINSCNEKNLNNGTK